LQPPRQESKEEKKATERLARNFARFYQAKGVTIGNEPIKRSRLTGEEKEEMAKFLYDAAEFTEFYKNGQPIQKKISFIQAKEETIDAINGKIQLNFESRSSNENTSIDQKRRIFYL